ncbi:MAG: Stk1 family PASTA domain-containing Ser/Thr kinase [Oscillospiraceae bacterium]|nr:Stk1 family PASTA domain-containing Ser/Thr kinase [Oscillospiraceae bacterium]
MDNYIGKRLDGRYEIQEVIGVGGMAVVYKAYDNIDDRIVAVKILKEEYLASEEFRRRFKNESKAIAVLSHPNIVKVYDVSYGDRLQYIVMEYVEGITLKEYIEQQGVIPWKETVHFTTQILRALQHAHDKGIVHRDVKPQNIMLLENGTIKVTDFGIARFSRSETRTMTDSAIGSVHYISPEQARGDITDDKADIYSVGVVMYEMLTGQVPFQSDNSVSVAIMQLQTDPKKPREINASIPEGLEQITMRAMQKKPRDRYQSAAEMILDLEEFKRNPALKFDYSYFVDTDPTKFVDKSAPISAPAHTNTSNVTVPQTVTDSDEKQEKNKIIPILSGIVIGFIAVLAIVFGCLFAFTDVFNNKLTVPNLLNKNYAEEILGNEEYKDFEIKVSEVQNSFYTPGTVYGQNPTAGTKVDKDNNIITVSVAVSEEKVAVPNVLKDTLTDATAKLKNAGFEVYSVPQQSTEPAGTVLSTSPAGGTQASKGSTITVYFASEQELVQVPNLIDQDVETAKALLESVNLKLDDKIEEKDSDKPKGTVIEQSYSDTEKVPEGTPIKITVSTGVPSSSEANIELTLPSYSGGVSKTIKAANNNNVFMEQSVILDGSKYTISVTGSGSTNAVKVYIDSDLFYECNIDFTKTPAAITNVRNYDISESATVPNVIGSTEIMAIGTLKSAGFNNINVLSETVTDFTRNGIVISQSPSNKSREYPLNTEITITVGKYAE